MKVTIPDNVYKEVVSRLKIYTVSRINQFKQNGKFGAYYPRRLLKQEISEYNIIKRNRIFYKGRYIKDLDGLSELATIQMFSENPYNFESSKYNTWTVDVIKIWIQEDNNYWRMVHAAK